MGTSTTAAEFSHKITKMATVTQARQKEIVNQGALTVKEIIYAEAAVKGVSPTAKIAGGRWGVRYDIWGFNNPTALVRIWGPFHLVDGATKPHYIAAKGLGGSRASRAERAATGGRGAFAGQKKGRGKGGKKAIAFGSSLVRAYVHHPGTSGKGIFAASKVKAEIAVPLVMQKSIVSGWRQALR